MLEPIYGELNLTAEQKKVIEEMLRQVENAKNSSYNLEARREYACRAHALYQVLLFDSKTPKDRSREMQTPF